MLTRKYRWIGCDILNQQSIVTQLAAKRGIDIYISKDMIRDPFEIKDMKKAVQRIKKAIDEGEKIAVYGDYDVDGITSTAILYKALKGLSADVMYYIPDRLDEGYGLNIDAVKYLIDCGVKLIITVDCGVTALDEIKYANDCGIDVIVTDHHTCGPVLPPAYCIVNPKREDDISPFKLYAGAGIAFKLSMALGYSVDDFIQYAVLGTVSDIVPLVGENRIIAKLGLEKINERSDPGITALIEVCGITGDVKSEDIGYKIGPRLNAAGRMSTPELGLKLLLTENKNEAIDIAKELNRLNSQRQYIENEIYSEAVNMVESEMLPDVLVLAKEGWHEGVIGIVASKLANVYNRPCIVISLSGDIGKGSCRSIKYFNIYEALKVCEPYLEKYGGHDMAAGLTIKAENIDVFKKQINLYAQNILKPEHKTPEIYIDMVLPEEYYLIDTAEELSLLEPYGIGNQKPVFLCKDLTVSDVRNVGDDRHLRLKLYSSKGREINAVGFNMGSLINDIKQGDCIDVVCNLEINKWNDENNLQFNLIDVRYSKRQITNLYNKYLNTFKRVILRSEFSPKHVKISDIKAKKIEEALLPALLKEYNNLIIVYSFRQLINFIRKFGELSENIGLCFEVIDDERKNILLVNPDYTLLDFSRFHNIIFLNLPVDIENLKDIMNVMDFNVFFIDDPCHVLLYSEDVCDMIPTRSDFEDVYICIKECGKEISSKRLIQMLNKNPLKIDLCTQIFRELGLIKVTEKDDGIYYAINQVGKVNLNNSRLYMKLLKVRNIASDFLMSKNIV
ncbi:exonuclease RecJ [Caldanaerobius fijiensis DSM 17918]|uniref:Single-stranded-DNA-specific exonuclease RecJ n=1 Tax=Caldanaerobius fijiensis DSM 17918 TaxID=1121256 RepID=A0A1M4TYZ6_9THEO|nr:single-stranded-DNA-specific exonuclease RecJ [Caldanaerobius fijiensis]SHE49564.1 exonuclease RecJ [Caldanaerobius fijiensis DSM 17918]